MLAPKHWHGTIEQALAELGYTPHSHREAWCYDLLLLPTFHASGWARIACDGEETYAQIAFSQGSERVEEIVIVTKEASDAFLARMTAIQPSALPAIDEGGRDGIVVQCWWQHRQEMFGFFAHNPTRAYYADHAHVLDVILAVVTESFRADQAVQEYLAHIQGYLPAGPCNR